ncbi:hypothetical protein OIU85_022570 [Salix viminalis]|uniref:Serine-threonine/tyrosine-protein kinase catalytic domain-containing protein n=1 Tax=Salix viminalis TaxID=40686 RepID=A0A9Q0Z7Z3_SALVM|nr:hypothetical protein OIU85_022570 [Salix viminalis]
MPNGSFGLIAEWNAHDIASKYFERGKVAVKEDVYSFGVVLLELLTGMKPTGQQEKAVVEDKRQEYVLDSSLECSPTEDYKNSISCALNQSPPRDLHGRDCQDA